MLKEVGNFFAYLLQRLSRLTEGIHHLKVVGQKIRQGSKSKHDDAASLPRQNLVTTHSSLGHCTGNLQALRHECQGLVNWYQSLPSGWVVGMVVKRIKMTRLDLNELQILKS